MKSLFAAIIAAVSLFAFTSCGTEGQWGITGLNTPAGVVTQNADGTYTLKPKANDYVTVNPDGSYTVKPSANENVKVNEDGSITIIPKKRDDVTIEPTK